MARRGIDDEALRDLVRGACLARNALGRPRPTVAELCALARAGGGATDGRVCRMVRELQAGGEIPAAAAGMRGDRFPDGGWRAPPRPRPDPRPEDWRDVVCEHRKRERRIRNGAILFWPGGDDHV